MAAPFAALEARSTAAVLQHLANVEVVALGLTVRGIFDNGYAQANVGTIGMASTQPTLLCRSADLPIDPAGLQLTVAGTLYAVVAVEPDGTGMTTLVLERGE